MTHSLNFPAHVQHARFDGVGYSFDAPHSGIRTDARERRTDAEVMADVMKTVGAPKPVESDPEREKVLARLKAEGRTPDYCEIFMTAFDQARDHEDVKRAKYDGSREGKETTRQAHEQSERVTKEKEKRGDTGERLSASERARLSNEEYMRNLWCTPPVQDARQDDDGHENTRDPSGPKMSASERARLSNEEHSRNSWQDR